MLCRASCSPCEAVVNQLLTGLFPLHPLCADVAQLGLSGMSAAAASSGHDSGLAVDVYFVNEFGEVFSVSAATIYGSLALDFDLNLSRTATRLPSLQVGLCAATEMHCLHPQGTYFRAHVRLEGHSMACLPVLPTHGYDKTLDWCLGRLPAGTWSAPRNSMPDHLYCWAAYPSREKFDSCKGPFL